MLALAEDDETVDEVEDELLVGVVSESFLQAWAKTGVDAAPINKL